jgi:tryptophan-rich sensory protein
LRQDHPDKAGSAELLRRVRRYALLLNLTLIACLLTPLLPGMISTALHYQSDDPVLAARVIGETQPIWSGPASKVWTTFALLLAAALCIVWNERRLRIGEKIWLAGSTLLLLKMGRFSPLFVLIAAPVLAATLPRLSGRMLGCPAVVALLAGLLAVGGWRMYRQFPPPAMSLDTWLNRNGPETGYPTQAAAFVEQNIRPASGHLINEFSWGGYLAWRLHGRFEILIDGRTQVYSPQMWRSLYVEKGPRQRQVYLASLQADAAVLPVQKSLFHDALTNCGWTSVYRDDQAEVLKPPQK